MRSREAMPTPTWKQGDDDHMLLEAGVHLKCSHGWLQNAVPRNLIVHSHGDEGSKVGGVEAIQVARIQLGAPATYAYKWRQILQLD
jgi:hypothetical protein